MRAQSDGHRDVSLRARHVIAMTLVAATPFAALTSCNSTTTSTRPTVSTSSSPPVSTASQLTTVPATSATSATSATTTPAIAAPTTLGEDQFPSVTGSVPLTFEATINFGDGPFSFPDPQAGLDGLASYQATLVVSFEGTNAGKPSSWTTTYAMRSAKAPASRQATVDGSGDLAEPPKVLITEVGGLSFEQDGQQPCTATVVAGAESAAQRLEPARFLTGVRGADPAGSEPVNGTPSDHYTFDEKAVGLSKQATSKGELWVATQGGYVSRYVLATTGTADHFGDGIEGTITWKYDVIDVNQPVTVTAPDGCPPGLVSAPLLADATNVDNSPGVLSFDTASSMADVITFYKNEIPKLGWKIEGDPSADAGGSTIEFSQGGTSLTVTAAPSATSTNVTISLSPLDPPPAG
jgi:hypothetical protein